VHANTNPLIVCLQLLFVLAARFDRSGDEFLPSILLPSLFLLLSPLPPFLSLWTLDQVLDLDLLPNLRLLITNQRSAESERARSKIGETRPERQRGVTEGRLST